MNITFPKISYRQWKQSAEKTLNEADFEKALATDTYEFIRIKPIYTKAAKIAENQLPGIYPYLRSTSQFGYKEKILPACSKLEFNADFNIKAKKLLSDPDTALIITFPDGFDADDFAVLSAGDFERALEGIDPAGDRISFAPGIYADLIFDNYTEYCQGINKSAGINCNMEFDCFGSLLINGGMPYTFDNYFDKIASVINSANGKPDIKVIAVNSIVFNSAGANAVQELAFAIASGVDVIRKLLNRSIDINRIANCMRFHFSVGANFFMEIAKFRAARVLWAKIIEEFGGDSSSRKINIHAETTTVNKATRDPHTNILRGTGEAMAAVLGGVDSLYVHPFIANSSAGGSDFAGRIARNTQRVIRDESHITDTIDPAGGSYYIESLTAELAESAWKLFQEIENNGGMIKAISDGIPQRQIEEVAAKRQENFRNGRDVLIGVNKYPNQKDLDKSIIAKPITCDSSMDYITKAKPLIPLHLEDLLNEDK